jgi:hypothetical protein
MKSSPSLKSIALLLGLPLILNPLCIVEASVLDFDVCGDPSEDCQSEETWANCLNLVVNGCQNIKADESACPRQYICEDDEDFGLFEDDIEEANLACASLFLYGNRKCHGDPVKTITFQTYTKPGSKC